MNNKIMANKLISICKVSILTILITAACNVYADYDVVYYAPYYDCGNCQYRPYHHRYHKRVIHRRHVYHAYHRYQCYSYVDGVIPGYWVNGYWMPSRYVRNGAAPCPCRTYGYDYDPDYYRYDPDMATGDDDQYYHPNMQISY